MHGYQLVDTARWVLVKRMPVIMDYSPVGFCFTVFFNVQYSIK